MNIRQTLAQIANDLDTLGMYNEASSVDGILQELPEDIDTEPSATPEEILQSPDAQQIVKDARDWVEDCEWNDGDEIHLYSDLQILNGVERHYDGGLRQFLKDRILTR